MTEKTTAENAAKDTPAVDLSVADANEASSESGGVETNFKSGKSWRFWAIFPALMVTTLLSAMEVTGAMLCLLIIHGTEI